MKSFLLFNLLFAFSLLGIVFASGCPKIPDGSAGTKVSDGSSPSETDQVSKSALSGIVRIDGSSTVFPITAAVAEEFMGENPGVDVNVGVSGTSGGFKKFVVGETDISNASRPIKQEEMSKLKDTGIEFVELPVAFDGIAVVVSPENDWVDYLTVEELKMIWQPDSTVTKWSDVRSGFPNEPLSCYGPGTDSGTFEYFTEAVVGEARSSRQNFTPSEDDNVLVQGVAGNKGGLGYFGYAYYSENVSKLKLVPIKHKGNIVAPSPETINNGTYQPLSRPVFIYVSTKAYSRPEVKAFVEYYLENGKELVVETGYVPLPDDVYDIAVKHIDGMITGTMFGGKGATHGISLADLMKRLSEDPSK